MNKAVSTRIFTCSGIEWFCYLNCTCTHTCTCKSIQGCRLRNTAWIYGLVVYAGHDTKLVQNSGQTKFKRTHLDQLINRLVIFVSVQPYKSYHTVVYMYVHCRFSCFFLARQLYGNFVCYPCLSICVRFSASLAVY